MGECRSQICTVGLVTGLFLAWGDLMGECRSQDESPETLMWTVRPLLEMNENNKCIWLLVTTCKRSLGQGNIFTCICHSVNNGEWVSVWCHFLSGFLIPCSFWGYLSLLPCYCLGVSVWECFCLGCLCLGGSLCRGISVGRLPTDRDSPLHAVGMHPTGMLTCSWLHWVWWIKRIGKLAKRIPDVPYLIHKSDSNQCTDYITNNFFLNLRILRQNLKIWNDEFGETLFR